MKLNWLFCTIGVCAAFAGAFAVAAEPQNTFTGSAFEMQPPTPATPPRPTQPVPPRPTQPGTTSPQAVAQSPVTDTFSQAPRSGSMVSASFQPFMLGDIVGGSFVRGYVFLPGAGGGSSSGNNGGGNNGQNVNARILPVPAVGRGSFKIGENESPRPIDRIFSGYNYFNGVGSGVANFPTFDLHRETIGFEKTFLNGDASVEIRLNTLQSTGDGSLRSSDFGDMTFVTKFALINDPNANVVTVGMAVTVPTGPDLILLDGSRINPVLLQPYAAFIYVVDRFYAQSFSSIIIPTDERDVTLGVTSLAVGYQVYRAADPEDSLITYLTPTIEAHYTMPLNHRGISDGNPIGFPDLLVLTNGLHIGLGRSANLTVGVGVPLTGPKTFDLEGIAQLNWRF